MGAVSDGPNETSPSYKEPGHLKWRSIHMTSIAVFDPTLPFDLAVGFHENPNPLCVENGNAWPPLYVGHWWS